MGDNGSDSSIATTVREVNDILVELKAALDISMSPQRVALRQLGMDGMGWTGTVYHDEAFRIWSDVLRRNPDDVETLHHLAIMHHARAIDREAGKKPSQADADWEAALAYWTRLWRSDAFWDGITAAACKGSKRTAVDALRQRFPELLLRIHFDIAFDSQTQPHRTRYHLRLVDASELPAECKESVRRATYDALLKDVPNAVWQPDVLDPAVIQQGTDVIEQYLALDPGCIPALEDAVRLQVRLLRARYTDLQAAGDDSAERMSLLQVFAADAAKWRPYFDQLLAVADQTAEDLRQKLCLWYRVMGDVLRALDRDDEAISFYESGAGLDCDDDEQRRCGRKVGETRAYVACKKAAEGASGARAFCDHVRAAPGLSPTALRLLANGYTLLDEFDTAEALCRQGLECGFDAADLSDFDDLQAEHARLRDMLEHVDKARRLHAAKRFIENARAQLDAGRYPAAILLLDRAVEIAPDAAEAWFLRCQCHLNLDHAEEARRDIDRFRALVTAENHAEALAAADDLEEEVRIREARVADFGVQGLRLRREAAECLEREEFEPSAQLLRQAALHAAHAGRDVVRKELAVVLVRWAVQEVNQMIQDEGSSPDSDAAVCRRAIERLEEAVRLDPDNDHAQSNLDRARTIHEEISRCR